MKIEVFKKTSDKVNALASLILYVFRCQQTTTTYDGEMIASIAKVIRGQEDDVVAFRDILSGLLVAPSDKASISDALTISASDSVVASKLIRLIKEDVAVGDMKSYLDRTRYIIQESGALLEAEAAINEISYRLNTKELSVADRRAAIAELHSKTELSEKASDGDVDMESISISDGGILANLNKLDDGTKITLKTGWVAFNTAMGGGLATGELVAIQAQQHKNKTGFTLALFLQTMLNNKIPTKDGLKPMWLWISLEDDLNQIVIKIFVYLYFRKYKTMPIMLELPKVNNSSNAYIDEFIRTEIEATGNRLELKRINNATFSIDRYKKLCKHYKHQGYRIITAVVDYLEKSYVDGNKYNTGATGSGLKNMVTMFRTHAQEENICFITPHQLSTQANDILRAGATDVEFLKLIVGKNYTQGSRGLSQDFDVEILIHLCTVGGVPYQAVQVGKFKRPVEVESKDKFLLIPFEISVGKGKDRLLAPLMEDSAASRPIVKESTKDELDL